MNQRLGWHRRGLLFGALFALAMAVSIPAVVAAITFMPDRQVVQRLSFPVSASSFPVAAGDTIADRVLGQMDFAHATENFADASTLDLERSRAGVAIDQSSVPNRVYVADFANHRVLGWTSAAALTNGKAANIVIGQPDFFSTTCNHGGVSASSLCGPVGVAVDGSGNLYVSDSFNNRVLEYNTPFTNTGEPGSGDGIADQVFGQEGNFTANLCNLGVQSGATSNTLCEPAGIAIDGTGVLYIADQRNNRVLEYLFPAIDVTANDVFGQGGQFSTTVCNKGGVSADSLCDPIGVATDGGFNNLYVADATNSRVLEYNNPPANDTTADNVLGQGNSANKFSLAKCNGGGAGPTATTLCGPVGVTIDTAGHLYVADGANTRVLEYTTFPLNTTANKVFGQGGNMAGKACNFSGNTDAAGLCRPGGVALDSGGNLYVSDDENNRVLKYNSALSGDTTADVVLGQPDFAHSDRNKVDASGFGGDTADVILAGTVDISALGTVAIDNVTGRIYVADTHNNRVLGFNNAASFANGAPASIVIGQQNFLTGTSKACLPNNATSSTLCSPTGVAVDTLGNLYVADDEDNRVLKFLAPVTTGKAASLVIGQSNFSANKCNGGTAPTAASLCSPWSLALDASGNLYVADLTNNRVVAYTKPMTNHPNAARIFGQPTSATFGCNQGGLSQFSLCEPTGVAVDSMGRLFIADFNNSRVLRFTKPLTLPVPDLVFGQGATGSNFTANACNGGGIGATTLCNAAGVAIDANFNLYVADTVNSRILHYNGNPGSVVADLVFGQGGFFTTDNANLGGTAPSAASLSIPLWLAVDNAGNLYAADAGNNRVLQYEAPLAVPSPKPTPGKATLSSAGLIFGNVAAGSTSPTKKVTLTNNGVGAIFINAVNRVGSNPTDFPQNNNCIGSLAGGKSCTINVAFSPSAPAGTSEAAQLVIYDNAKNAPQALPVYGTSALPATLAPTSLGFGNVAVASTSPAKNLTLTNNRSTALTISSIALGGTNPGDFLKTTSCGASLAAFASCTISVKFKPTALGARSATVKVNNSASLQASLTGTGTAQVTVAPSSLSFGSVSTGATSAAKSVNITNNQSTTLTISGTTLSGVNPADFLKTTTCGASLAAFTTCSVSVKFKPTASGPRSAIITITDSPDTGSPHKVSLGGTGL